MPPVPWILACPLCSHLVDGQEPTFEALTGYPQVDAPDAHAFVPAELPCTVEVGLEAVLPLEQRAGVVVREVLDVAGVQAGALDRGLDPREVQRGGVREHVALRERSRLGLTDP